MADEEDSADELGDDTGVMNPVVEVRLPDNMDVEVFTILVLFKDGTQSHFRLLNKELGAGQVVPKLKLAKSMRDTELDSTSSPSFMLTHYSERQDARHTALSRDGGLSLWYDADETGKAMCIRLVASNGLASEFMFVEHDTDDAPTLRIDPPQDEVTLHVIVRLPAAYGATYEIAAAAAAVAAGHAAVPRRILGNADIDDLVAADFAIWCDMLGLAR